MIRKLHQGLGIPAEVLDRIRSNSLSKVGDYQPTQNMMSTMLTGETCDYHTL